MSRVILKENVDSALNRGIQAVVDQDFKKGIDLLEFYLENMQGKEVPLEPLSFLMLAYFSTEDFDKAYEIAVQLNEVGGLPDEITELIRTIMDRKNYFDPMFKKIEEKMDRLKDTLTQAEEKIKEVEVTAKDKIYELLTENIGLDWQKLYEVYPYEECFKLINDFINDKSSVPLKTINDVVLNAATGANENINVLINFKGDDINTDNLAEMISTYFEVLTDKTKIVFLSTKNIRMLGENSYLSLIEFIPSSIVMMYCYHLFEISERFDRVVKYRDILINVKMYRDMMQDSGQVVFEFVAKHNVEGEVRDLISMVSTGGSLQSRLKYPDPNDGEKRREYINAILTHAIKSYIGLTEAEVKELTNISEDEVYTEVELVKVVYNTYVDNIVKKDDDGDS